MGIHEDVEGREDLGNRLLRPPEVASKLGISLATLWRRVKAKSFPPPIKLGAESRWSMKMIDAIIDEAEARSVED